MQRKRKSNNANLQNHKNEIVNLSESSSSASSPPKKSSIQCSKDNSNNHAAPRPYVSKLDSEICNDVTKCLRQRQKRKSNLNSRSNRNTNYKTLPLNTYYDTKRNRRRYLSDDDYDIDCNDENDNNDDDDYDDIFDNDDSVKSEPSSSIGRHLFNCRNCQSQVNKCISKNAYKFNSSNNKRKIRPMKVQRKRKNRNKLIQTDDNLDSESSNEESSDESPTPDISTTKFCTADNRLYNRKKRHHHHHRHNSKLNSTNNSSEENVCCKNNISVNDEDISSIEKPGYCVIL